METTSKTEEQEQARLDFNREHLVLTCTRMMAREGCGERKGNPKHATFSFKHGGGGVMGVYS